MSTQRLIEAGPLTLRVRADGEDGVVIEARGELDVATARVLHEQLFGDGLGPDQRIVLDLGGLSFIDSSGIREIIHAHERLNDGEIRFSLARPVGQVADVLAITGVDQLLVVLE